jgi:pantetheine-phosphate adenylyltransferase
LTIAIYPGSFDPVTLGHLDIIKRASSIFEELIVGVYDRPEKRLLFSTEERVQMIQQSVAHLKNAKAQSYSGLTVDFAKKVGAQVLVRGLRMSSDFEREFEMAMMNKKLAPGLELVCFMANLQYQFLSSSLLKEVAQLGGCLEQMVPDHVAKALKRKFAPEFSRP